MIFPSLAPSSTVLDPLGPLADLLGGDADLPHVLGRLLEMLLQLADPVVQPVDIVHRRRTFPWMTCACSRMRTSFSTARTVVSVAISVVGETIQTRARDGSSTRFGKLACSSA